MQFHGSTSDLKAFESKISANQSQQIGQHIKAQKQVVMTSQDQGPKAILKEVNREETPFQSLLRPESSH